MRDMRKQNYSSGNRFNLTLSVFQSKSCKRKRGHGYPWPLSFIFNLPYEGSLHLAEGTRFGFHQDLSPIIDNFFLLRAWALHQEGCYLTSSDRQ